jgi:hypothetical protein
MSVLPGGRLIDGMGVDPNEGATVAVDGAHIVRVDAGAGPPRDAEVIEVSARPSCLA